MFTLNFVRFVPKVGFQVWPRSRRLRRRQVLALGGMALGSLGHSWLARPAQGQQARRWLELGQLSGSATLMKDGQRVAQVGDRLEAVGHGLRTGNRSSAALMLDAGIGSIQLAENTHLSVQRLDLLRDGGMITYLRVIQGQARLQVRRFTHRSSRLELHTPSGVAAVRGTEFGVDLGATGVMAVGTAEGRVDVSAQGVTVPVPQGLVSRVYPGEPPLPGVPLDRVLDIQWRVREQRGAVLVAAGRIAPGNRLLREDRAWRDNRDQDAAADPTRAIAIRQEVALDRDGEFSLFLPLDFQSRDLNLYVTNALGETRLHTLVFNPRG